MLGAFSGGKDSTAMVLRLHELGEDFRMIWTPTGNELPGLADHIEHVERLVGRRVEAVPAPTLAELIDEQDCLPNWRMRWCTRMIKVEPCAAFLADHPGEVLCVGLRADEEGRAGGTYEGSEIRYPLREWNWGLDEVLRCCERHGVTIPERTDCAVCFFQTLHEWWRLWKYHPAEYEQGVQWEDQVGHTFRSPQRDTQPASLRDLRTKFEAGYTPKARKRKVSCRVCSM